MTQSEKKVKESEISASQNSFSEKSLQELGSFMYFTVLKGRQRFLFTTPIEGYLNVLLSNSSSNYSVGLQGSNFVLHPGDNILLPVTRSSQIELKSLTGDCTALLLLIPTDKLPAFHFKYINDIQRFQHGLLTKADNRINLSLQQIFLLYEEDSFLNQLRIQSLLLEVLAHQVEGLYAENDKKEIIINKDHFDKIKLVKKLIDEDLSKNHSISELAKAVGTNEQYLKKYFKQHFGKTVMNYITETKMEHAKRLILIGKYRVSDVARMTGYKHSTHFTTAFKKYFGIIPNSLRYTFLVAHEGAQLLPEITNILSNF